MKKIIYKLVLISMLIICFLIGKYSEVAKATAGAKALEFKIVSTTTKADGATITEYNNGSWSYINLASQEFSFTPVELGDWDYQVSNIEQLENIISTYKEIYEN